MQDNVPPFDSETALEILRANLGADPRDVFATFDDKPIAAASLGQVHLATLRSGEQVVVKVQRPGLKDLFDIDLKNIRCGGFEICKALVCCCMCADWLIHQHRS